MRNEKSYLRLEFQAGIRASTHQAAAAILAGVREYWIVNLQQDTFEVFRQPADGKYQSALTFAQTLSPLAFEEVKVPVADIIPPR